MFRPVQGLKLMSAIAATLALSNVALAEPSKTGESKSTDTKAETTATAAKADKSVYSGPPVLDASRFFGFAAVGYASAKAAPEVMAKLFCYCGCDATDNHSYLIDCFTGVHGVDCHICQEEAVMALKMHRDNTPIAQIQKTIDQQFASKYPFAEDTPTYKKYKATRLWKFGADEIAGPSPPDASGSASQSDKSSKPKLKPGFAAGSCCVAGDHKDSTEKPSKEKKTKKEK